MALKVGPIDGHMIMLDAQSDPNCIWIMCSCGANLSVQQPPSGNSLKESIGRITEHLGKETLSEDELERRAELFDLIFQPEED